MTPAPVAVTAPRRSEHGRERVTLNTAYVRALECSGLVPLAVPTMIAPDRALNEGRDSVADDLTASSAAAAARKTSRARARSPATAGDSLSVNHSSANASTGFPKRPASARNRR